MAIDDEVAGGTMYHDEGYAGLPYKEQPTALASPREQHHIANGVNGVGPNVVNDALRLGPSSVLGALLLKKGSTSVD